MGLLDKAAANEGEEKQPKAVAKAKPVAKAVAKANPVAKENEARPAKANAERAPRARPMEL